MSFGADPSSISDSLASLQRRFEENPRRYFASLANEYRKSGDIARALEICRSHLPHQPGHLSGYVVYAQTLFDAGQLDDAAAIFEETLKLDPENIMALQYAGDIARSNGNRSQALSFYERALSVDPANEILETYVAELQEPVSQDPPLPDPIPVTQDPVPEALQTDVLQDEGPADEYSEPAPEEPQREEPQQQDLQPPQESPLTVTSPFVTETMAELYLQQGFVQEALLVYKQLAATRDEPRFQQKVWELEGGPRNEPAVQTTSASQQPASQQPELQESQPIVEPDPEPPQESVRDFFERLAVHAANLHTANSHTVNSATAV